jgi:hypothetical protein
MCSPVCVSYVAVLMGCVGEGRAQGLTVEEVVLEQLGAAGGWAGVHSEARIWRAVFAYLLVDVLFGPVDPTEDDAAPLRSSHPGGVGVHSRVPPFRHAYQDRPADLLLVDTFYARRALALEAHLAVHRAAPRFYGCGHVCGALTAVRCSGWRRARGWPCCVRDGGACTRPAARGVSAMGPKGHTGSACCWRRWWRRARAQASRASSVCLHGTTRCGQEGATLSARR